MPKVGADKIRFLFTLSFFLSVWQTKADRNLEVGATEHKMKKFRNVTEGISLFFILFFLHFWRARNKGEKLTRVSILVTKKYFQ